MLLSEFKVTKSNDLIESGYSMTLNEQRLLLSAIAQIDSRKGIKKDFYFRIDADQFAKAFKIPLNKAYGALREAAQNLYKRDLKLYDKNGKTREQFRWVFHVLYHEGQGFVDLGFSPNVIPELTRISSRFTSYELRQVANLGSPYAIRIYEILKQYETKGTRSIDLERFKKLLEIEDAYNRFSNLKARVIDPAVKEINRYTDIKVEWQAVRKGRSVSTLEFTINQARQQPLEFH